MYIRLSLFMLCINVSVEKKDAYFKAKVQDGYFYYIINKFISYFSMNDI